MVYGLINDENVIKSVQFDTTATPTHSEGRISCNDTDKTVDIHTNVNNVNWD